jgi:hypothetical protein
MASERANWRNALARGLLVALAACGAAACADNPLAFGKIDATSPVAADVAAAQRAPGPYPSFSRVPPVPKDVRSVAAWRTSVYDIWGVKRQTEAEAAAIPFVLTDGDTESWAAAERGKIPAAEMAGPTTDTSAEAEAYAAAERARATPPPSSK